MIRLFVIKPDEVTVIDHPNAEHLTRDMLKVSDMGDTVHIRVFSNNKFVGVYNIHKENEMHLRFWYVKKN